mmetsp:Transcript_148786/g.477890  ORF Transcript_148786/g.477890 Transcript_148786/m.477890 type:complete len:84 (-) Transcript_148786:776-1027(-)
MARNALEALRSLSQTPWSCVLLPMGLDCLRPDLSKAQRMDRVWDYVAGGILEYGRSAIIDEMAPNPPPLDSTSPYGCSAKPPW